MPASVLAPSTQVLLDASSLDALLSVLERQGYSLLGPRACGTAITYGPIKSANDLPRGWGATQRPGSYRLRRREDEAAFAYGPAFESLKRYLLPPSEVLLRARREKGGLTFRPVEPDAPKLAVVGVRPCELQAIARLDTVLLQGPYADPGYRARRAAMFLVAVNCTEPGETCFCASMQTGPRAVPPFDIAMTEIPRGRLVAEAGSEPGAAALASLRCAAAPPDASAIADAALEQAAARMGREVLIDGLARDLAPALEHAAWDDVAKRCLACGNCTMVCPTCFCHTIEDRTDLTGEQMERRRRWDTCFTAEFSYIHGGSIRASARARYRQWLTHKFCYWVEQFRSYGCVGCGRCITWCPVGIDVTEEIRRLRG
ncbi:MAG TPA: 4Fe-4S dicluster domain-containing protein [Vicinamibacterales bacterium]|nr:4Fe-4S dicluster domain-containing protein [Vicinamibacterales bacterium]